MKPNKPVGVIMAAPKLLKTVSRKAHGSLGNFDLLLSTDRFNPTIEPRTGGVMKTHLIVFVFDQNVVQGAAVLVEGYGVVSSTFAGAELKVSIVNVSNNQYLTIFAQVVTAGGILQVEIRLGILLGDVDGNRTVTLSDVMAVNAAINRPINSTNFRLDVNLSGGISQADVLTINGALATMLPAPYALQGSRKFGMEILGQGAANDFYGSVNYAKAVGASWATFYMGWSQIDPNPPLDTTTPSTYVDPWSAFPIFNQVFPQIGFQMLLSIGPISTNLDYRPEALKAYALDNPLVISRYLKMIEWVLAQMPDVSIIQLHIGNEIDSFPTATQASYWTEWNNFASQVIPAIKALRPGIKVSASCTMYNGIRSANNTIRAGLVQLYNNPAVDMISVNYYPLNADFTLQSPYIADADFDALMTACSFSSKPIHIPEIGYSTGSSYQHSSEEAQRIFLTRVFAAWDKYASRIPYIGFYKLNDCSLQEATNQAGGYGLQLPAFIEYLQTSGVRTYEGANKLGYAQLQVETTTRRWAILP